MLTYPTIARAVARQADRAARHQRWEPGHEEHGGIVLPHPGIATVDHTAGGAAALSLAWSVLIDGSPRQGDAAMLERAEAAIAFLDRRRRPSGLIDLPKVDFDSPPDTAFMVQLANALLAFARRRAAEGDELAARVDAALTPVLGSMASAVVGTGFRTPNHRWVVASALAGAMPLFPDLDASAYVASILAEGPDAHPEGWYSERSAGIYDAVTNRAFRQLADRLDRTDLLDHVRANLELFTSLLEPDGTVVTAASHRQDAGHATRPTGMLDTLLDLSVRDGRPDWADAADVVFDKPPGGNTLLWLLDALLSCEALRDRTPAASPTLAPVDRALPHGRVWRGRDAAASFTVMAGDPAIVAARCGGVRLRRLSLRTSYFHYDAFRGESFEPAPAGGGAAMRYQAADRTPPGWDLPLGRPVEADTTAAYYRVAAEQRERRLHPPLATTVRVERRPHGLDVRVTTEGGFDRVPFIVEAVFSPGAELWTETQAHAAVPGGRTLLRSGFVAAARDGWAIRVGPGADDHAFRELIDRAPEPKAYRVLIPLMTPIDRVIELRWGAWSAATRDFV